MLKKIINKIWNSEGQEDIATPSNENAAFILKYKDIPIGYLTVKEGVWKFSYSDQFRKQNDLTPLVDFPNTKKDYESTQLWPFFSYRIPGLNQPSVQDIIKKDAIDQNNEVALLKKFGQFSVYNPFMLTPSA
jgi:HipA-like protein